MATFTGTSGNDSLVGGAGDDILSGLAGDDTLIGGTGNDNIDGGSGNDSLDGGPGFDNVNYSSATSAVTVDLSKGTASDGLGGTDTLISIENIYGSSFADKLTGDANGNFITGNAGNDTIDGGAGGDTASYSSATAAVAVDLSKGTASDGLGGTDTLISIENIYGSNFADTLKGDANNNFITGNAGDDTIDGGAGFDTANYFNTSGAPANVGVTVDLSNGTASDPQGGTDTLTSVEQVVGTAYADTLTAGAPEHEITAATVSQEILNGRGGNDTIIGGGAHFNTVATYVNAPTGVTVDLGAGTASDGEGGTDVLSGLAGVQGSSFDDYLKGGSSFGFYPAVAAGVTFESFQPGKGNDTVDGGWGIDQVVYSDAPAAVNVDLGAGKASDGYGTTDTLISVERAQGSNFNDTLTGGGSTDAWEVFQGSPGNDIVDGKGGFDYLQFNGVPAPVNVDLGQGKVFSDGQGGVDTIANIEGVIGSKLNDTLKGSAASGEEFIGNAGNDRIDGGGGVDTVSYVYSWAGATVNLATGTASDGYGGTDTISNIANVTGSTFADSITGSAADNQIVGGAGADTIIGGAGNDILQGFESNSGKDPSSLDGADSIVGGAGDDVLRGNSGNDTLLGGDGSDNLRGDAGDDSLDGGAGNDGAAYRFDQLGLTTGVNFDASAIGPAAGTMTFADGQGGQDTLTSVEFTIMSGTTFADTLTGSQGGDQIFGNAGDDSINAGAGDDFALNGGAGNDTLDGGSGIDLANYEESTGGVTVDLSKGTASDGLGGTDKLVSIEQVAGSAQGDMLIGGDPAHKGSDSGIVPEIFYGNGGNDTIVGGGDDFFSVASYLGAPAAVNVDLGNGTASDGQGGNDTLVNVFGAQGSAFNDVLTGGPDTYNGYLFDGGPGDDTIDGGTAYDTFVLYYAPTGAPAPTQSGAVIDLSKGTATDVWGGHDSLKNIRGAIGSQLADTITGDGNNNMLIGLDGADTLDGGLGFDRVNYQDVGFAGEVRPFQGVMVDLPNGKAIDGWGNTDTLISIENVNGSSLNDTLIGDANNNSFRPGAGDDSVDGGANKNDIGWGDEVAYDDAAAPVTVNLSAGTASGTSIGNDTLAGIENIQGSAFNDTLTGDANDNRIAPGAGNDQVDGGLGSDTVIYRDGTAPVTVDLSTGIAIDGWGNTDTLAGIEGVLASDFADTITLAATGGWARGYAGDDSIVGSASWASMWGDSGNDTITGFGNGNVAWYTVDTSVPGGPSKAPSNPQGINADLTGATGTVIDSWGTTDTLVNIQNVGGSQWNDTILGGAADNAFWGGFGNDSLAGGAGNDWLYGEAGNDTLMGGAGNDTLDGGAGTDRVDYSSSTGSVSVNLSTGIASDGYGTTDALTSIEQIIGSAQSDTLTGNSFDNLFAGLAGDDTIEGGAGNDTASYFFAPGAVMVDLSKNKASDGYGTTDKLTSIENINGSAFNDTLTGDANGNTFTGNAGDDTIDGGAGFDTANYFNLLGAPANVGVAVDLSKGTASDPQGGTDTLTSIEFVQGTAYADKLTGGTPEHDITTATFAAEFLNGRGGNDTIIGGGAHFYTVAAYYNAPTGVTVDLGAGTASDGEGGTDVLSGLAGVWGSSFNDYLKGGSSFGFFPAGVPFESFQPGKGNDTVDGGSGIDAVVYTDAPAAVNVDLGAGTAGDGYGTTDTLISVERVRGSNFNDTLTGGSSSDAWELFEGSPGNDSIDGKGGFDYLQFNGMPAAVRVDFSQGQVLDDGQGGVDTIAGIEGVIGSKFDDTLIGSTNSGEEFIGNAGNDTIDGGGGVDRVSYLYSFAGATVNLATGSASDGYGGTDTISNIANVTGSTFADSITGDAFANVLEGGKGNDTLTGGAGTDTFVLASDSQDTVTDFAPGVGGDILDIGQVVSKLSNFTPGSDPIGTRHLKLTQVGPDALLEVDADGGGPGAYQGVALLKAVTVSALTAANFTNNASPNSQGVIWNGTANNDSFAGFTGYDILNGLAGNDTLIGGAGNDTLDGGPGTDSMVGGTGDDTFIVDSALDVVIEAVGEGTDAVVSAAPTYTLALNVENLTLAGSGDLSGTGNALNNVITGNAGNNSLNGGLGADTLVGGAGNDTYTADNAGDVITENPGEGTDQVNVAFAAAGSYTLANNVENATVTSAATVAVNVVGNAGDNVLTGNGAANSLSGAAGNDTLIGGTGIDTLAGGAGDDVYVVDVAGDVITEISGEGTDQVNVAFTVAGLYTLGANVENATVTSAGTLAVNVTGNAENNLLTGNAGANSLSGAAGNDTLIGGAGIDKMAGGTGNDVYVVDVATDVVTEALNEGTDFVSVAFAVAGTYTLTANVENATAAAGTLAINLVGSTDNNLLTGNAAANSLSGGDGNDDLMGGDGNDTLLGGAGRDSLRGGAGNDSIDGGIITDRINYTDSNLVYYTDATAGVNVNLSGITGDGSTGTGTAQDGLGGTDTLANVNRVIGSSLNDTLTGSTALLLEQFDGGAGDDTIDGGVITDTLNRDNNNRVLYDGAVAAVTVNLATGTATGGAGNDKLLNINQVRGSAYGDWLTGSNSSITESFFGLAGDDTIDGAGGYDAARYEGALAGVNVNLITGSASDGLGGTDTLFNIEGIHGSDFADVLTGGSTLNGTGATDGLEFFRGGGGSDIIDGGAGYDRVDYTSSTAGANVVLGGTANGTAQDGLGGTDTLINIEAVGGSAFNDILTGSDTGVFESFEGREGNDTIDGKGGTDRADYQNSTAGVTVNLSTGLASDGYGGTDALLNIENVRGSRDFNDSITGSAGDNKIEGLGGNDTINGMAGNDALYAGTGVDVVDGGTESDTLVVMGARVGYAVSRPNATDTVLVNAGTGENITIRNVENVQFTDGTLTWTQLTANSASPFADLITGTAGNDTLNGLAGNDTLVGLAGDDLYVVDVATDVVTEALNEGTDLVNVAFAAAGTYTLPDNVENATAATGTIAINLVGNTSNNVLTGNAAANSLTGGDGNDTLDGGAGSDTMVGGVGNDVYVVDIATDVVNETAVGSSGVDEVRTSLVSYTLGASTNIENLRYTGSASFSGTGNALNNAIWGGSGNDLLTGGLGDDSLYGGKGDDTYIVDSAADVVAEFASAGTDSVQSSVSYTLADNVENLALTGTAAIINGTGNALSNVLTGNTAANILTGGDGNDTLDGGTDTDTLVGGAGNDTYVVDRAGDVITENPAEGIDQVNVAYVGSGGTYTLGADVENAFVSSASTIAVNLVGNALDNVLTGNAAANILIGGAGNDTLQGGLGADVYVVDAVGDVVIELGGSDIDRVQTALASYTLPFLVENLTYTGSSAFTGKGNFDRNVIIGGPGDDTLIGAGGSDTIDGGPAGDDVMVLQGYQSSYAFARLGPASSTFTQGLNVTTALNIESVIFDADGNLGTTNDQTLVSLGMLATAGNDTLTGDDDVNDNLNGLAGNDSISGGGGDDMLQGGPGVDTLVGGPGNDLLDGGDGSDVYRFSMGQGDDIIDQNDTVAANIDTLEFTDNIAPGDVTVSRGYHTYDDLVVRTSKGGNVDQVIVSDFFKNDAVNNAGAIDQIRFTGGDTISTNDVLWTRVQLATKALTGDDEDNTLLGYATTADSMSGGGGNDWMMGSAGNDTLDGGTGNDALYGGDGTDTLVGGAGNDYLAGGAGNDSLDGGPGNDSMTGGSGSDTYRFGNGSGQDVINDDFFTDVDGRLLSSGDGPAYYVANGDVPRSSDVDVLNFGGGVLPSQLQLTRAGNDLLVNLADPGDQLTIRNFFSATIPTIEKFVFADGTSWTGTTIRARVIQPTAGDDSFIGYVGADRINGLAGNDTINGVAGNDTLNGGDGNDSLLGDLGNDSLMGDAGNDTLSGGAGNNTLIGGTGNDQMSGGTGNDVYRYTLGDGLDGITDAGGTADRIEITAAAKTTADLVVSRLNGTGRMIAISGQDALAITNHDGAGAVETFALNGANFSLGSLATGVDRWDGTIGTDSLSGGSNAERMMGNASNDILQGNDGNDSLVGGTGNDTLYGGKGDDQYVFNPGDGADVITETSGTDALVFAGTASTDWRFSLTASDALLMQRIADPSDSVTVTNFGLDVAAGTGPSLIESFQFTGGTPTTLNVSDVTVLVSTGTSGDDSIIGTSGADTLTGLAGNDTLQGNNGNDNLLGGASDDSLYGGKGDDTLVGGAGADSLLGGDGNDRYVFASGDGADVITEASGTDTLVFSGMASTEWRFSLTQDSALRIERIADPTDSVTVANFGLDVAAGTGPSLIESFQFTGGTPATLTVADVRALVGTGTSGADSIIGTSAADTLDGLAGNDTLQGNNGNDSLLGGAGDDSLYGGKGDDVLVGGAGDNWLDGGSGNDMYRFGSTATGISTIASDAGGSDLLQLDDGVTITARAWEDTSLRLTLSQGGEILVTSPDAMEQVRFGSAPATGFGVLLPMDTVTGTSGNDILGSSSSTNPVMLDGSGGNDTLYGGKGDDILVGGAGADTLVGSMGSDEYQFSSGWGQDVISDTGGSLDVINLSGTGLSPSQVFAAKDSDGSLVLTRSGGSDLIQVYNHFTNSDSAIEQIRFFDNTVWTAADIVAKVLAPTDGSDSLVGFSSNDSISGGLGDDTLRGGAGNDTLNGDDGQDLYLNDDGSDVFMVGLDGDPEVITYVSAASTDIDTLRFSDSVGFDKLWFKQSGNDLLVTVLNTLDTVTLTNWFAQSPTQRLDLFEESSGQKLYASDVQTLVEAMAAKSAIVPVGISDLMAAGYEAVYSAADAVWN